MSVEKKMGKNRRRAWPSSVKSVWSTAVVRIDPDFQLNDVAGEQPLLGTRGRGPRHPAQWK